MSGELLLKALLGTCAAAGIALVAMSFITPEISHAQVQISASIPGAYDTSNPNGVSPSAFVADFYQYALMIGGLLAFAVVVYGGIRYMLSAGNASGQSDAREWIRAAVVGILLLAGAYFILKVINPDLVNLSLPGLNSVGQYYPGGGGLGTSGGTAGGNGRCTAPSGGPCSVTSLANTCMGANAAAAAQICNAESSANPTIGSDISTNGQPVSIGLFQINLSANTIAGLNCPAAFDHSWHMPGKCGKGNSGCGPSTIVNPSLYAQCVAAAQNVQTNIAKACSLSSNGTNWGQWSTHTTCGL